MGLRFYTIGVYGRTEAEFYQSLLDSKVDLLVDTRRRRGMRGPIYAWANSARMQAGLKANGIGYHHELGLAPPEEVRNLQRTADAGASETGSRRSHLSLEFAEAYRTAVLDQFDFKTFFQEIKEAGCTAVAFLCVEERPEQCHRSLISEHISERFGVGKVIEVDN